MFRSFSLPSLRSTGVRLASISLVLYIVSVDSVLDTVITAAGNRSDSRGGVQVRPTAPGDLDPSFTTQTNGVVFDIFVQADGKILIGGAFSSVNGTARGNIARLNRNGSLDNSFNANINDAFYGVAKLLVQPDGKILAAGGFTMVNGAARSNIVRFNTDGSTDNSFNASTNSNVFDMVLQPDGKIIVGGLFTIVDDVTRKGIARLNSDGTLDALINVGTLPGESLGVRSLGLQTNGRVLFGGDLSNSTGQRVPIVVRLTNDGNIDASFTSNLTGDTVSVLKLQQDSKILIGGEFTQVNGAIRIGIARLNTNGSTESGFSPSLTGGAARVRAIDLQEDGKILIGGSFTAVNGQARSNVARLNSDGTVDSLTSTMNNWVEAVTIQQDGKIILGGYFTTVNGSDRFRIARLNGDAACQNVNVITDGGFEGSNVGTTITNFNWPSTSTIFGTSLCSAAFCGGGVAKTGTFFTWFGGTQQVESASIQQTLVVPVGTNPELRYWLRIGAVAAPFNASMVVKVDGLVVQTLVEPSVAETDHTERIIALPASVADGAAHIIRFEYNNPSGSGVSSFFVDDISLLTGCQNSSRTCFDYDGDGRADRTVRRPGNDLWYLLRTTAGYTAMTWGQAGDLLAPADYDGDGRTDIAVFRPATGTWFIVNSGNGAFLTYNWGADGDLPVPADHNADGKADLVLFRQSNGMFYRRMSDNSFSNVSFGVAGDKPVIGDFDNDGQFDIGVYRPSNNNWYIRKSTAGFFVQTWGEAGDIPVPADYDGDGQTDLAVWRSSNGRWYRAQSTAGFDGVNWGQAGDKPIPADYDGDGKADVAIFRPSTGTWYMIGTTIGQLVQQFGQDGDVPTPSAFIY